MNQDEMTFEDRIRHAINGDAMCTGTMHSLICDREALVMALRQGRTEFAKTEDECHAEAVAPVPQGVPVPADESLIPARMEKSK